MGGTVHWTDAAASADDGGRMAADEDGSLEMVTGEGVVLRADFDEVTSDAGTLHQMTITALDKGEQVLMLPVAVYSAEEVERQ